MKLSKREKILLLLLALVAITVLGFRFGVAPQIELKEALNTSITTAQDDYIALRSKAESLESSQETVAQLRQVAQEKSAEYIPVQNAQQIESYVHAMFLEHGLKPQTEEVTPVEVTTLAGYVPEATAPEYTAGVALAQLNPPAEDDSAYNPYSEGNLPRLRYQINFEGRYADMQTFLKECTTANIGVVLEGFSFARAEQPGGLQGATVTDTVLPENEDEDEDDEDEDTADGTSDQPEPDGSAYVLTDDTYVAGYVIVDVYMLDHYRIPKE